MSLASSIRLQRGALLTMHNHKTEKGEARGVLTGILYLAPASLSGFNVCQHSNAGCREACLFSAGRGALPTVVAARMLRTHKLFNGRADFMRQLRAEIAHLVALASQHGMTPAVRLNGTSDLPWHRMAFDGLPNIMAAFPGVQFYDYTKRPLDARPLPSNYALTFSLASDNGAHASAALQRGASVAVVMRKEEAARLPMALQSRAIDGDAHDLRFTDPPGSLVILSPKGRARRAPDDSGLVMSARAVTGALLGEARNVA